ncbi:MAG: hypothetical protein M3320_04355, partial [Actinomycetota bacterium]|nr:hypothetical protein [Actinomycetota bacterium]
MSLRSAVSIAAAACLLAPASVPAAPRLADRCIAFRSVVEPRVALRVHVKPTGLQRVMLHDEGGRLLSVDGGGGVVRVGEPEPGVEWAPRSFGRRGVG